MFYEFDEPVVFLSIPIRTGREKGAGFFVPVRSITEAIADMTGVHGVIWRTQVGLVDNPKRLTFACPSESVSSIVESVGLFRSALAKRLPWLGGTKYAIEIQSLSGDLVAL